MATEQEINRLPLLEAVSQQDCHQEVIPVLLHQFGNIFLPGNQAVLNRSNFAAVALGKLFEWLRTISW